MKYGLPIPPKLWATHLKDARLFANRDVMLLALANRPFHRVAEVGVAFGDFSAHLLAALLPKEFHAFDLFDLEAADRSRRAVPRWFPRAHALGLLPTALSRREMFIGDSSTLMGQ
jgi:hypothetical protein